MGTCTPFAKEQYQNWLVQLSVHASLTFPTIPPDESLQKTGDKLRHAQASTGDHNFLLARTRLIWTGIPPILGSLSLFALSRSASANRIFNSFPSILPHLSPLVISSRIEHIGSCVIERLGAGGGQRMKREIQLPLLPLPLRKRFF